MAKRFSFRDLARAFPARDFERGRRYFEQGRVRHFDLTEHEGGAVGVRGEVLGSGGRVYRQEVDIDWDGPRLDVFSSCTCAVGFDCKHVVALCLMVRRHLSSSVCTEGTDEADARLRRWLARIENAGAAVAPVSKERLSYVLTPRSGNPLELGVELRLVRERRDGTPGKGRTVRLDRVVELHERTPFLEPADLQTIRLLTALCPELWNLHPELRGALGFLAMQRMLDSGRCTYAVANKAPLQWGDPRSLNVTWTETSDGRLGLDVSAGLDSHVLATEPPVYVDGEAGLVGPLETPLRPEQICELAAAPTLLAGDAGAVARLLGNEFPELPLPMPSDAAEADAHRHPLVPCLTLTAAEHDGEHRHELRLGWEYGGHAVRALPQTLQSLAETASGPVRLHRDRDAEELALARLTDLGFELLAQPASAQELRLVSPATTPIEAASRWSALVHDEVPQLQAEGWRVRTGEAFVMRFEPAAWHGVVAPTGSANDWFELRFDLDIDGERVPLLPLLLPLLARGFDQPLPARVSVPVGSGDDHRYVDFPAERLAPFLDTLREVFHDREHDGGDASVTLSRFDAGLVGRLAADGHHLEVPDSLARLAQRLADFDGIRSVRPPQGLCAELRPYQQQGLDWLQFLREYQLGGILADDMGLGKTLQTLAHLLVEKNEGRLDEPALIVAPTSLMGNWRREAARFAPGLSVLVLHGPGRRVDFPRIPEHDVVLTTYPLLSRDRPDLEAHSYHALVLDEAQTIKNPRSKAAVVVRELETRHRLCLTGTPMENHLGELWAQFDFLMPGFLGDEEQFRRQWRRPIEEQDDVERRQHLARRLKPFMLRRRKQDVLHDLPPKSIIVRSVPLGDKQAGLYESVRLAMSEEVRTAIAAQGLARSHITILDALLKLRQICCDPRLLSLEAAREVRSSAKLEMLMRMLPAMLAEGRRVLLFSQFTSMLALIEAELERREIDYSLLTGQTRDREAALERFRDGSVDLLLVSLKAGGVGLNLTEADTVILYDPWWNPAVEAQAADRAHRIGQTRAVFVYKLVAESTVEEKILALQARKRELADGVHVVGNGDRDGAGGVAFDAEDLRVLLS